MAARHGRVLQTVHEGGSAILRHERRRQPRFDLDIATGPITVSFPALDRRYPIVDLSLGGFCIEYQKHERPVFVHGAPLKAVITIGGRFVVVMVEFVNELRGAPGRPADRIFLSAGVYESLIYFNRSLLPVLQGTGADVRLVEAQDGHNWENWRDRMRDGLTWLFPGPLWMFYE